MNALHGILSAAESMRDVPAGMAFAPFLLMEQDAQILSSAGLYFCGCAFPSDSGDVTTGAQMVIEAVSLRADAGDSEGAGALASGLMLLGDERFLERMHEAWNALDPAGKEAMVRANSGLVTDAHVRFLMEQLRTTANEHLYGIAAALHRLSQFAEPRGSTDPAPGASRRTLEQLIEVLESWTKNAYYTTTSDQTFASSKVQSLVPNGSCRWCWLHGASRKAPPSSSREVLG